MDIFSHTFGGTVWRIEIDTVNEKAAFEIRNNGVQTQIALLDMRTNELLAEDIGLGGEWWINLCAHQDGLIFLQVLNDPQNPEDRNTWVYHLATSRLYKKDYVAFKAYFQGKVLVKESSAEGSYMLLDDQLNGAQKLHSQLAGEFIRNTSLFTTNMKFPVHYLQEDSYFDEIKRFVKMETKTDPVKAVDYLEVSGLVFISYYIYESGLLSNYLLVLCEDGKLLMHHLLGKNLKGIGSDTFFIWKNNLLFIENNNRFYSCKY